MRKNQSWSLLQKLFVWYGSSVFLLFLLCSTFLYYNLQISGYSNRNAVLQDRLAAVESLLKSPAHGKEDLRRRVLEEWPPRGGEQVYIALIEADNKIWLKSPGFPDVFFQQVEATLASQEKGQSISVKDDTHDGKFLARAVKVVNSVGLADPVTVFVAIGDEQNEAFLNEYRRIALITSLLGTLLSLGIGWKVSQKGLEPLKKLSSRVSSIDSRTLNQRLDSQDLPVELHDLTRAFNRSLDRLQDSFERLSNFSTDIAHELRTPLTNMMGEIEVSLARPRNLLEYQNILNSNLEETARLKHIVESLLFLGRTENLKEKFLAAKLDLLSELNSVIDFFEPAASEGRLKIVVENNVGSDIFLKADPVLFQRVIVNILSNAIKYSPDGGTIRIELHHRQSEIEIKVVDEGIGISEKDLVHIFERFYRAENRISGASGFGLGLAIAKSIVELHRGTLEIKSQLSVGTALIIHWPIWDA